MTVKILETTDGLPGGQGGKDRMTGGNGKGREDGQGMDGRGEKEKKNGEEIKQDNDTRIKRDSRD